MPSIGPHRPSSPRRRPARRVPAWKLALAGAVLFGATAGAIYWYASRAPLHAPAAQAPTPAPPEAASAPARQLSPDRVQHMIDEVGERVKANPKDASAWALLAHSYEMVGRYEESTQAYARLVELLPNDAQVLADYADALAAKAGRHWQGEPLRLLRRALAADPRNLKALLLSGAEAFDRHAYGEAIDFWEHARKSSSDAGMTAQIESGLAEARLLAARAQDGTRAGRARPASTSAASAPAASASAARAVSGRVVLAPALQSRVSPEDTVFVFARPTLGSRMPVALLRRKVRDLPLNFRLDDSAAMVPDIRISALSAVVVGARISPRGDATPHAGDLQGLSASVAVGSAGVEVEIKEVLQ